MDLYTGVVLVFEPLLLFFFLSNLDDIDFERVNYYNRFRSKAKTYSKHTQHIWILADHQLCVVVLSMNTTGVVRQIKLLLSITGIEAYAEPSQISMFVRAFCNGCQRLNALNYCYEIALT